jgi:hypothetical protein
VSKRPGRESIQIRGNGQLLTEIQERRQERILETRSAAQFPVPEKTIQNKYKNVSYKGNMFNAEKEKVFVRCQVLTAATMKMGETSGI